MSEDNRKRRILVVIGSDSDLKQCLPGLLALKKAADEDLIEVIGVHTMSVHRNTAPLFRELENLHRTNGVDVIITGAGWANHLTGMVDAYLRYTLCNDRIVVLGVGFEDTENELHSLAAELSMTQVPGTQVVTGPDAETAFCGTEGFMDACTFAIDGELPGLRIPTPRPTKRRTLDEAIAGVEPDPNREVQAEQS